MSDASRPKPKWTEICEFFLKVLVAVAAGGFAYWKYWPDRGEQQLRSRQTALALARMEEPIPIVEGQVYDPQQFFQHGTTISTLRPVIVQVRNDGTPALDVDRFELRYFRAKVASIVRKEMGEDPDDGIAVAEIDGETSEVSTEDPVRTGVIDVDSPQWEELTELRTVRRSSSGRIPPGQSRYETFHLYSSCPIADELHRVSVTVYPKVTGTWQPLTWYGFIDSKYCGPVTRGPGIEYDRTNPE